MNKYIERKLNCCLTEWNGKKVFVELDTNERKEGVLKYNGEKIIINDGMFLWDIDKDSIVIFGRKESE